MTDASTRSTPRASDPADGGAGVGGPHGNPEAPITTPQATKNKTVTRPGDRIFGSLASGSAVFITLLVAAVGIFLIWRAVPALQRNEVNFLTSRVWDTDNINAMAFGVLTAWPHLHDHPVYRAGAVGSFVATSAGFAGLAAEGARRWRAGRR